MVLGRNSMKLPETFKTLSLERQPMELGRDLSWLDRTSNTSMFSSLAVKDSGISCYSKNIFFMYNNHRMQKKKTISFLLLYSVLNQPLMFILPFKTHLYDKEKGKRQKISELYIFGSTCTYPCF